MPFITEEIYQSLPHDSDSIMISPFPKFEENLNFKSEAEDIERIITVIKAIRARRSEMNVAPSRKCKLYIVTKYQDTFKKADMFLKRLAYASETEITNKYDSENSVSIVTDSATVFIPLADMIDFDKERARLSSEIQKTDGEIERIEKKLSNEGFVSKAPKNVIDAEREKLRKYQSTKDALVAALEKLN